MNDCYIGKNNGDKCHLTKFTNRLKLKTDLQNIQDLNDDERTLIFWRSGVSPPNDFATSDLFVCLHHKVLLLQNFSQRFKKCCNIFNHHPFKSLPAGRRVVTLEMAKQLHPVFPAIVPGHKMCSRCFTHAKSEEENASEILTVDALTATDDANTSTDGNTSTDDIISTDNIHSSTDESEVEAWKISANVQKAKGSTDASFSALNQSPMVLHSLPKRRKIAVVRKKLEKAKRSLTSELAVATGIEETSLMNENHLNEEQFKKYKADSIAFQDLMAQLKEKFQDNNSSYADKLQILTLKPSNWTIEHTSNYFGATKHAVLKANEIKEEKGIISKPGPRHRKGISSDVINLVISAYEDDEVSRLMPGMKDRVSLGKSNYKQKRLMLCSVKELYELFKEKYPASKIGLTKFFELQ